MGYVATTFLVAFYEGTEIDYCIYLWHPRLATLLNSSNYNLLQPLLLYNTTLRELAIEQGKFINSHFRSFLVKPFHALHHLRGSNGQMQMTCPLTLLWECLNDLIVTMVTVCGSDRSLEKATLTIHEHHIIAFL